MGCQSEVELGQWLTFSICTHDPDTGVLTDADNPPSYRIYEDENTPAILTGNMAILDDINTTGFYTERVQCSTGNGFTTHLTYTIYIEATVDGDTGGICYAFRVTEECAPWDCAERTLTAFGEGAVAYTYTVTNTDTGLPIEGVTVWVTTDLAGLNIVWAGATDAFGIARDANNDLPMLDPGTYYFWKQRVGFIDDDNPDTEVVS